MFNLSLFIIFISILCAILLLVNFVLASHKPYREKKTPFECGYHSFLQNRSQFTISFFIFALLFLIFDIEIVLIYPFTVSSFQVGPYGFFSTVSFIIILTLGLIFEIGKKALTIYTKQENSSYVLDNNPYGFINLTLQNVIFKWSFIINILKYGLPFLLLAVLLYINFPFFFNFFLFIYRVYNKYPLLYTLTFGFLFVATMLQRNGFIFIVTISTVLLKSILNWMKLTAVIFLVIIIIFICFIYFLKTDNPDILFIREYINEYATYYYTLVAINVNSPYRKYITKLISNIFHMNTIIPLAVFLSYISYEKIISYIDLKMNYIIKKVRKLTTSYICNKRIIFWYIVCFILILFSFTLFFKYSLILMDLTWLLPLLFALTNVWVKMLVHECTVQDKYNIDDYVFIFIFTLITSSIMVCFVHDYLFHWLNLFFVSQGFFTSFISSLEKEPLRNIKGSKHIHDIAINDNSDFNEQSELFSESKNHITGCTLEPLGPLEEFPEKVLTNPASFQYTDPKHFYYNNSLFPFQRNLIRNSGEDYKIWSFLYKEKIPEESMETFINRKQILNNIIIERNSLLRECAEGNKNNTKICSDILQTRNRHKLTITEGESPYARTKRIRQRQFSGLTGNLPANYNINKTKFNAYVIDEDFGFVLSSDNSYRFDEWPELAQFLRGKFVPGHVSSYPHLGNFIDSSGEADPIVVLTVRSSHRNLPKNQTSSTVILGGKSQDSILDNPIRINCEAQKKTLIDLGIVGDNGLHATYIARAFGVISHYFAGEPKKACMALETGLRRFGFMGYGDSIYYQRYFTHICIKLVGKQHGCVGQYDKPIFAQKFPDIYRSLPTYPRCEVRELASPTEKLEVGVGLRFLAMYNWGMDPVTLRPCAPGYQGKDFIYTDGVSTPGSDNLVPEYRD